MFFKTFSSKKSSSFSSYLQSFTFFYFHWASECFLFLSYSHLQNTSYRHVHDFDINLSPFLLSFHESCYASVRVLGMQLQSVPAGLSRGKARSRQELQGQWDRAMCVFVCARVGAGGGRRWEGCLRTLTAPVAWAMTAGVGEASRRSIVAELDPCNRGAIGCSALGLNDINPDV